MRDWSEVLRQSGLRTTPQRLMILRTLEQLEDQGEHRHVTAREIFAEVQSSGLGLKETTVYRALEEFHQKGLVDVLNSGTGALRFSLRRSEQPHGHLVCRGCGQLQTVDLAIFQELQQQLLAKHLFVVELNHVTLRGCCSRCS